MLVLFEGQSLVVQKRMDGWDQCQNIDQERDCERDCDAFEVMVWVWVFQQPMRVVHLPVGECGMWVAVTMFPHGCATAPESPELECANSQGGTHCESKMEALVMECLTQVC